MRSSCFLIPLCVVSQGGSFFFSILMRFACCSYCGCFWFECCFAVFCVVLSVFFILSRCFFVIACGCCVHFCLDSPSLSLIDYSVVCCVVCCVVYFLCLFNLSVLCCLLVVAVVDYYFRAVFSFELMF